MKVREAKANGDEYHKHGSERQIADGALVRQALGKAFAESGDGSVVGDRADSSLREE